MRKTSFPFLIALFLCLSGFFAHAEKTVAPIQTFTESGEFPSLTAIELNRQAVRLLKDQKPAEALNKWAEALGHSPMTPEIHFNMGLAFEALEQPEKAIQSYQTAERLAMSHEVQFLSRFNQGALHQKAKRVDDALNAYHGALMVNPTSRETKINIELLIQQQQKDQQQKGEGEQKEPKDDGQGKGKDQKDKKDPKDGKDKKDQEKKDPKDEKGDQKKEDKPKEYAKNPKPQPRPFDSKELAADVAKKILGELLNQEQRIRADYNKREVKEKPRDKDW